MQFNACARARSQVVCYIEEFPRLERRKFSRELKTEKERLSRNASVSLIRLSARGTLDSSSDGIFSFSFITIFFSISNSLQPSCLVILGMNAISREREKKDCVIIQLPVIACDFPKIEAKVVVLLNGRQRPYCSFLVIYTRERCVHFSRRKRDR